MKYSKNHYSFIFILLLVLVSGCLQQSTFATEVTPVIGPTWVYTKVFLNEEAKNATLEIGGSGSIDTNIRFKELETGEFIELGTLSINENGDRKITFDGNEMKKYSGIISVDGIEIDPNLIQYHEIYIANPKIMDVNPQILNIDGGTKVTFTGEKIQAEAKILLNGTELSIENRTDHPQNETTRITFLAPKGLPGIRQLSIVHPDGGSTTFDLTYVDFDQKLPSFFSKEDYTTLTPFQIEKKIDRLVKAYPYLLTKEIIGKSADGKNLYAVQMTTKKDLIGSRDPKTYHFLVEAGTHARETANPYILLRTLETYVQDYHQEDVLGGISVKSLLEKNVVIHFLPLTNPDGYGLVKGGVATILTDKIKSLLKNLPSQYALYKASATGVDLNRNFPEVYYDVKLKKWVDFWGTVNNKAKASKPGPEFYFGKRPATEPEVQAVCAYIERHDFRWALSYHSRGHLVYQDRNHLGLKSFDQLAKSYGSLAAKLTGYKMTSPPKSEINSGYFGDYFANETLRPAITLETSTEAPALSPLRVENEYERTKKVLGYFIMKSLNEGKSRYRVYKPDGEYFRDFIDGEYAQAVAKKINGTFVK